MICFSPSILRYIVARFFIIRTFSSGEILLGQNNLFSAGRDREIHRYSQSFHLLLQDIVTID